MKKIVIVGGKLQGTEACYLGTKAGIEVTLIDKEPQPPACKMCTRFIQDDVSDPGPETIKAFLEADMVLPTLEDLTVLENLEERSKDIGAILAFDLAAYRISSSKKVSDELFRSCDVSVPEYYPGGKAPYMAKPDSASGSCGVVYLSEREDVIKYRTEMGGDEIIQEYLEGPSYSIEIIGAPGNYRTYPITQIHIDDIYDCCRVTCPCTVTEKQRATFEEDAIKIAEAIGLKGIMDFEVIDDKGIFKMLEIDARLPSQTPSAVYRYCGVNYIEELYDLFVEGEMKSYSKRTEEFTVYEHFLISEGEPVSMGEHIMTQGGPLIHHEKYMGADEIITDKVYDKREFRVTAINSALTLQEVAEKRREMISCLKNTR